MLILRDEDSEDSKERRDLKNRLAQKKLSPGEVRRGTGKIPEEFWTRPRPKTSDGSLLQAFLEDREDGR
jgi:hypothetical protein